MPNWDLKLPFDTDSPDFVRGFEAGRIYERMKDDPDELDGQMFHATNAEMVIRMIETTGASLKAEFTGDDVWMVLKKEE